VPMAVVVVTAMAPEAVMHVPVAVVMVVVTMAVRTMVMTAMGAVVTVAVGVTDHAVMTAMAAAALVTAAALRTSIGSGRDERRQADDGGGDECEECSTFEHGQRPFGSMWAIRAIGRGT
jgi:hypothetical protein